MESELNNTTSSIYSICKIKNTNCECKCQILEKKIILQDNSNDQKSDYFKVKKIYGTWNIVEKLDNIYELEQQELIGYDNVYCGEDYKYLTIYLDSNNNTIDIIKYHCISYE